MAVAGSIAIVFLHGWRHHAHELAFSAYGAMGAKEHGHRATIFGPQAKRFEERVTSYVEDQLEAAFTRGEAPKVPYKLAAGGLGIAFLSLLMLVVLVAATVLIVKLVI